MPTPIDENNTISYFERGRHTAGLERLRWWCAWQLKYRSRIGRVVDQDRTLLTALGPIGETRLHEHLASSDVGVIHVHEADRFGNCRIRGTTVADPDLARAFLSLEPIITFLQWFVGLQNDIDMVVL